MARARRLEWLTGLALSLCLLAVVAGLACHRIGRGRLHDSLRAALETRDLPRIQALIRRGANVDIADRSGLTPLMVASMYGDLALVDLLLRQGADLRVRDDLGATALYWALTDGRAVERLLDAGAMQHGGMADEPILCSAAFWGDLTTLQELVRRGADVNARAPDGETPVVQAARSTDGLRKVRYLLGHGARLKSTGRGGDTLLTAAVRADPELVEWLLRNGFDADEADPSSWTPLMIAASVNEASVAVLLRHGADANHRSRDGWTPLYCAKQGRQRRVIRMLRRAGAREQPPPQTGGTVYSSTSGGFATSPQPPEPYWNRIWRYLKDPR